MNHEGDIQGAVQELARAGEFVLRQKGINSLYYNIVCARNYIKGLLRLPTAKVEVDSNFYSERRNTPWRRGG